jgi:hypothetical protein
MYLVSRLSVIVRSGLYGKTVSRQLKTQPKRENARSFRVSSYLLKDFQHSYSTPTPDLQIADNSNWHGLKCQAIVVGSTFFGFAIATNRW